ncbi:hypothetical protein VCHENC02_0450A, partial [Vibrio harveyi]
MVHVLSFLFKLEGSLVPNLWSEIIWS